jgi:hypothetical protein
MAADPAPSTILKNYDPSQVVLTVGGRIMTGYGEGTFITLVRNKNNFELIVNPTGDESVRSKVNNRSGLLSFTLLQTSTSNLILSNLANRDEIEADGVVPVSIKDLNGESEFIAARGYIEKTADAAFAATVQGRQWRLQIIEAPFVHGGTPSIGALTGTLV